MSDSGCPGCGCRSTSTAHDLVGLVMRDDLDRAIDAGLLDAEPCPACSAGCRSTLAMARDGRRAALAVRVRFRAREHRLALRAARRAEARAARSTPGVPSLPVAAANALQRALAKAKSGR